MNLMYLLQYVLFIILFSIRYMFFLKQVQKPITGDGEKKQMLLGQVLV